MDNFRNEEWRDIKGYEGLYQISNLGRIKSFDKVIAQKNNSTAIKKGRILHLSSDGKYLFIGLTDSNRVRKNYKVHRLVAFAFPEICGEWFEGAEVNHKNEIKTDNRAENLEWCTQSFNVNYGTRNQRTSEKNTNGPCSKTILQYSLDEQFIKEWPSVSEIQRTLNYNRSFICQVCKNKYKQAYGFIWRYKQKGEN